ncbi:MAG: DUF2095 family protein [Candidatus Hodarchaeales archaeon]
MDPQKKDEKKRIVKVEEKSFITDEANSIKGLPIDQVKNIAPNLYKEIASKEISHDVDEVYDSAYNEEEFENDNNRLEDDDIIDVNEENLEILAKVAEKRKSDLDAQKDYLGGFDPTAIDFIRRANTEKEAIEIINYLEKRKELKENEAKELKEKLETEGLESFGSHKQHGYYFQIADEQKLRKQLKLSKRKDDD